VYLRSYVLVCILYACLHVVNNKVCATDIKSTGIKDLTTCMLVECCRPFGGTYCLNLPGTSHFAFNVVSSWLFSHIL